MICKPGTFIDSSYSRMYDFSHFVARCALAAPWEGFVMGIIGAILALATIELLDKLHWDDPVGKLLIKS